MPSELLQGEDDTNWGILNGNFFNGSLELSNKYKDPSLGSGKNMGTIASDISRGTWTIGSKTVTKYHIMRQ